MRVQGFLSLFVFLPLLSLCGCEKQVDEPPVSLPEDMGQVTVGFSQVGSESDWRMASTQSVQSAFAQSGRYSLIFNDGQQKQENQIKAIREFIDQDVDYILLDPCVETGWDSALLEAKEAGIPVIVFDREVDVSDDSLYTAWVGSDFYLEGERGLYWLEEYLDQTIEPAQEETEETEEPIEAEEGEINPPEKVTVKLVGIQGTLGASPQLGRTRALEDMARYHEDWELLELATGDFTTAKGKEVMEDFLRKYGGNIDVVYCENDNMAYGAIEAIEEAGYRVGMDVNEDEMLVLSFDATHDGLLLTMDGRIAANTECSPLYGPRLVEMIDTLESGGTLEKMTYIEESQFSTYPGIGSLRVGEDSFFVTLLTEAILEEREY